MPILFFSGVRTKYYAGGGAKTINVVGIFDRRNVLEISGQNSLRQNEFFWQLCLHTAPVGPPD